QPGDLAQQLLGRLGRRPRWVDGTSAASGGHCAPEPAWPEDRPSHRRRIALGRCVQEVAVREMSATKGLEQRPFDPLSRTIPRRISAGGTVPIGAVKGGNQDERSSSRAKLGLSMLRDSRVAMDKPIQEDTTKAANAQKTRKSSE